MTLSIPDFSELRVLIAGDAMLDEYWFGDTARISPEAPVPVVRRVANEQRPGGAANVALNLATLGARTTLLAIVGDDERGRQLSGSLEASGVDCRFLQSPQVPTIHKLRVLARSQQLIRLDAEDTLGGFTAEFEQRFIELVADSDVVILSDYAKGTLSGVEGLIAAAAKRSVPVLVDPKGTAFERYRGVAVLTPNQSEFQAVAGPWQDEDEFVAKGEALRAALDLEALLITRGERGMTLLVRNEPPVYLSAQAREVFDVTGAGDTVIALMGAAVGMGLGYDQGAALANLGAGLVVGKIGAATVSCSELRLALHGRGVGGRGVVTADELGALVREAKARGERVVMTNGCFDILHAGHVAYLEEAKSLGDRLVVAVNDDDSVRRLKGESRPVNALEDRMAVLAGLAAVDWVVAFAADTPAELVRAVLPDVLVKGGDYEPAQIVGADAVIENGGEVRALGLKPGRSTSGLIETIRGRGD